MTIGLQYSTRLLLPDGGMIRVSEASKALAKGEEVWAFSRFPNGQFATAKIHSAVPLNKQELWHMVAANGFSVTCMKDTRILATRLGDEAPRLTPLSDLNEDYLVVVGPSRAHRGWNVALAMQNMLVKNYDKNWNGPVENMLSEVSYVRKSTAMWGGINQTFEITMEETDNIVIASGLVVEALTHGN